MTEGKATHSKGRIAWGRYLLLFFVAAWMFVLGILVGRGSAPIHFDTQALQKELLALRDAMLKKEREAVEKAIRGENRQEPLEFYEALKKDAPDTGLQLRDAPAEIAPPATPTPADASPKPPHKARNEMLTKGKRTAPPLEAASPPVQKTPARSTNGQLTIQVTALKDGAAAERIVANLKRKGYPAYLSRIVIPDKGLWYRVRVGSYADRNAAAGDLARLTRDQNTPILVEK